MSALRSRAAEFGLTDAEWVEAERREGRELNALEAAIVGAMWSEHCSYKNSRPLMRAFPTTGPQVLQGPGENAGVVDIGDGYGVAFKVESHNHPSAVEPVQGAATGVGGILRDIFAMGARPFALLNSLRLGDHTLPRTRYLLNGIVTGIAEYGNPVGVPTVGGEVTFHPSYNENPLVNVMALGLLKHEDLAKGTLGAPGNRVIYVGSRTGRDGTGGAVFSSAELSEDSAQDRPAVQVGDPFMEKLLLEATLEAIEAGLVAGVQDMGAAGLLSSTSEMAHRGGLGVDIRLDAVPTREDGLEPWELVLSESQERMILVPVPGREQELFELLERWELEVAEIGEVAEHGRYRLHWHGELVCDLDVALLNEAPTQTREGVEDPAITALRQQARRRREPVADPGQVLAHDRQQTGDIRALRPAGDDEHRRAARSGGRSGAQDTRDQQGCCCGNRLQPALRAAGPVPGCSRRGSRGGPQPCLCRGHTTGAHRQPELRQPAAQGSLLADAAGDPGHLGRGPRA